MFYLSRPSVGGGSEDLIVDNTNTSLLPYLLPLNNKANEPTGDAELHLGSYPKRSGSEQLKRCRKGRNKNLVISILDIHSSAASKVISETYHDSIDRIRYIMGADPMNVNPTGSSLGREETNQALSRSSTAPAKITKRHAPGNAITEYMGITSLESFTSARPQTSANAYSPYESSSTRQSRRRNRRNEKATTSIPFVEKKELDSVIFPERSMSANPGKRNKSPYQRSLSPKTRHTYSHPRECSMSPTELNEFSMFLEKCSEPRTSPKTTPSILPPHEEGEASDFYVATAKKEAFEDKTVSYNDLPYLMQKQTRNIESEVKIKKSEEMETIKETNQILEQQWASLPISFLFERNIKQYAKTRGIDNIFKIMNRLSLRYQSYAFNMWTQFLYEERFIEKKKQQDIENKNMGCSSLLEFGQRLTNKKVSSCWQKWKQYFEALKLKDLNIAAVKIQRAYRNRLGKLAGRVMRKKHQENEEYKQLLMLQTLFFERNGCKNRRKRAIKQAVNRQRNKGAMALQKVFRGRLARKQVALKKLAIKKVRYLCIYFNI
jgi:hypothetical protein